MQGGNNTKKCRIIGMLFTFGMVLPTFDCYSDIQLAYVAFSNGNPLFGISLLAPMFLNMAFQVAAFWKYEEQKSLTWPLLILQLWHQYRWVDPLTLILLLSVPECSKVIAFSGH